MKGYQQSSPWFNNKDTRSTLVSVAWIFLFWLQVWVEFKQSFGAELFCINSLLKTLAKVFEKNLRQSLFLV